MGVYEYFMCIVCYNVCGLVWFFGLFDLLICLLDLMWLYLCCMGWFVFDWILGLLWDVCFVSGFCLFVLVVWVLYFWGFIVTLRYGRFVGWWLVDYVLFSVYFRFSFVRLCTLIVFGFVILICLCCFIGLLALCVSSTCALVCFYVDGCVVFWFVLVVMGVVERSIYVLIALTGIALHLSLAFCFVLGGCFVWFCLLVWC